MVICLVARSYGFERIVPDDAAVGPTIAGMLDERGLASDATIQEGAVAGLLSPLLRVAAPVIARVTRVPGDTSFDLRFRHLGRELHSLVRGARHGALGRTQTFLCMSKDDGDGTLELVRDRIRVRWPQAGGQVPFRRIAARLAAITRGPSARRLRLGRGRNERCRQLRGPGVQPREWKALPEPLGLRRVDRTDVHVCAAAS